MEIGDKRLELGFGIGTVYRLELEKFVTPSRCWNWNGLSIGIGEICNPLSPSYFPLPSVLLTQLQSIKIIKKITVQININGRQELPVYHGGGPSGMALVVI